MLKISKETNLCISIAERPSNFGTTIFNAAFAAANLDFIYKACRLDPSGNNLKDAIGGIKALGIKGCGVSMPFKVEAIKYMDILDESALRVGAINTILNNNGTLKGFNTDYYGAREILGSIPNVADKRVFVLGSGGVALAICAALRSLGVKETTICNRTEKKANLIAQKWGYDTCAWTQRNEMGGEVLINATSIGMSPQHLDMPVTRLCINNFDMVVDVVINPINTLLLQTGLDLGKTIIAGHEMTILQAAKQYEIYTNTPAPLDIMTKNMQKLLNS